MKFEDFCIQRFDCVSGQSFIINVTPYGDWNYEPYARLEYDAILKNTISMTLNESIELFTKICFHPKVLEAFFIYKESFNGERAIVARCQDIETAIMVKLTYG